MAKTITLDKFKIENVQIHRRTVKADSGEIDSVGNAILIDKKEWALSINYTMLGTQLEGEITQGAKRTFALTEEQQDKLKLLLKPYVKELKTDIDIQDGEEWADEPVDD